MGGIQRQDIHAGGHQGGGTLQHVAGDADGGCAQQAPLGITGGVGILDGLFDVLDGDQALQGKVVIHQRQLFDLVGAQDLFGVGKRGVDGSGDQVVLGHNLSAGTGEVFFKFQVPVGQNAHQAAVLADGDAGDAVFAHQLVGLCQRMLGGQVEGPVDDAVFRTLDPVYVVRLLLDGHTFVHNADAALTGDGDGHGRFGDGVHGGRDQGNVQPDVLCQLGGQVHLIGRNVALRGDQEHIVKGDAFFAEFAVKVRINHSISPPQNRKCLLDKIYYFFGGVSTKKH